MLLAQSFLGLTITAKPSNATGNSMYAILLSRHNSTSESLIGREASEMSVSPMQNFLTAGRPLVKEVGYIPLQDAVYELALKRVATRMVGSVFGGKGSQVGVTLESLLSAEKK